MDNKRLKTHEDLQVFQLAFVNGMKIFEISKQFPQEEKYSLTDQIRRSSRSVCANLAQRLLPHVAWRKRRYQAAVLVRVPLRLSSARGRTALLLN